MNATEMTQAAVEQVGADIVSKFEFGLWAILALLIAVIAAAILRPVLLTASERLDSVFKS